jgi:hypothetical protein
MWKMYKGVKRKGKWKINRMSSYFNLNVKIYPCKKLTTCSKMVVFYHIKNRMWKWEVFFEGVEVEK